MTPDDAVDRYLNERKPEVADSTWQNHSYALRRFVEYCNDKCINDIRSLDGRYLQGFKVDRRMDGINEVTLYNNMSVLRVFVGWLESMRLVEKGTADVMQLPEAKGVRHEVIREEGAEEILAYLERFEYATMRHALFALLWETGMRLGAARSIDVDEYHSSERYIELHHRPEEETPLKNKERGEREINLHEWTCRVLDDYIEMHREDTTDDYDRGALFASKHGRYVLSNLRQHINALTRPCHYGTSCPHDREQSDCEANQQYKYAQRCPSSITPHDVRRSSITAWLDDGHSAELISDRMDVSKKILDKHYDKRTEEQKRRLRREMFDMD